MSLYASGGKIVLIGGGAASTGASGPPLLFFDNFVSGNLSHTQNGIAWADGANVSVIANPTGQTPPSGASTNVLQFSYNSGNQSEQRYSLGTTYTNVMIQWDIYYPTGFVNSTGTPTNNKMLRMWMGDQTDGNDGYSSFYSKAGGSTTKAGTGPNLCNLIQEYGSNLNGGGEGQFGNNNPPQAGPPFTDAGSYANFLTTSDLAGWMTLKFHVTSSSAANNNGSITSWKNGVQLITASNLPFYTNTSAQNGFNFGNILGFANTGYVSNPQLIYVTNVNIWASP